MAAVSRSSSEDARVAATGDLKVDVRRPSDLDDVNGTLVLVEPLYGCLAVSLALEAGWGSVEIAAQAVDAVPIPLVSFEQVPPDGHGGGRCRVRADDLFAAAHLLPADATVVLACPANARPVCAWLAHDAAQLGRITFVATDCAGALAADSWWACGMLTRVLLEEADHLQVVLSDAAGLAVTVATGGEDVLGQLTAGGRWRRHLECGGAEDDLRLASAIDSVGLIPRVGRDDDQLIVTG